MRGALHTTVLCAVLILSGGMARPIPPDGAITESSLCGSVVKLTSGLADTGLEVGSEYDATLTLKQRLPDFGDEGSVTIEWLCDAEPGAAFSCGDVEISIPLAGEGPPEIAYFFGPVSRIVKSMTTYHLDATLDELLLGEMPIQAAGALQLQLLSVTSPNVANEFDVTPGRFEGHVDAGPFGFPAGFDKTPLLGTGARTQLECPIREAAVRVVRAGAHWLHQVWPVSCALPRVPSFWNGPGSVDAGSSGLCEPFEVCGGSTA